MKKITAFAAAALVASVTVATAGGPVTIVDEPAPVVETGASSSSGLLLPLAGLGVVAALVASSSGSH
jgi:hypothetical protein